MLKVASVLCVFAALTFGQQAQPAPDQIRFHFANPVVQIIPMTTLKVYGVANSGPFPGSLESQSWNFTTRAWEPGIASTGVDFVPGKDINLSMSPTGTYKFLIGWNQSDGEHKLTVYWFPNGVNGMIGDQAEWDLIGNLSLGPAQELISVAPADEIPFLGTVQLGGIAPPYGDDVIFDLYQGDVIQAGLHADKGKYSVQQGSVTCESEVTIDFDFVGAPSGNGIDARFPVYAGVESQSFRTEVDQLLFMPFSRPFEGQCQPE
jgi:hypothetical protein